MRIVLDENTPRGVRRILTGHDVRTVAEAGRRGRPDPDVLADATADGRAILTHNHRHFKRLHARGQVIVKSRIGHAGAPGVIEDHQAVNAAGVSGIVT